MDVQTSAQFATKRNGKKNVRLKYKKDLEEYEDDGSGLY